jgi:hypothetical protein
MLSAVHVMGMKTARQHLRNPPRIEKTSFLGLERNRVRRFPSISDGNLLTTSAFCSESLCSTEQHWRTRLLEQKLVPSIHDSDMYPLYMASRKTTRQTTHSSAFLLYPIILRSSAYYPNPFTIVFYNLSIDQREEQEWKDTRLYTTAFITTAFISFRQRGFISLWKA